MRICGWLPLDRPSPSFQIFYPWPRAQTISPGTSCSCPSFWSWLLSIVASGLWHFAFIPWSLQVEVSLSLRAAPLEESTWVPVTLQSWLRLKCWRVSLGLGAPYDIVYDEAYFGNVEMADRKFVSTEIPINDASTLQYKEIPSQNRVLNHPAAASSAEHYRNLKERTRTETGLHHVYHCTRSTATNDDRNEGIETATKWDYGGSCSTISQVHHPRLCF